MPIDPRRIPKLPRAELEDALHSRVRLVLRPGQLDGDVGRQLPAGAVVAWPEIVVFGHGSV